MKTLKILFPKQGRQLNAPQLNSTPSTTDPSSPFSSGNLQTGIQNAIQQIVGNLQISIYTKFETDDVVQNQTEIVTGGLWSNNVASLTTYFTSSTQTVSQRTYYVDVLQEDPTLDSSERQFVIAYGHALGSGSSALGSLQDSPSKAIYSQYKQLLLPIGSSRFQTQGSGSTNSIYVVNFNRDRIKERLDPGNFELPLVSINTRATNATGSVTTGSTIVTLIDDSGDSGSPTNIGSGRVFNLVSGSIATGIYNPTAPEYYGKVYIDYGIIVLDGNVLDQKLNFQTNTNSNQEANNHFALFHAISGSAGFTNPLTSDPYGFLARNSEKITSTHYFVRIKNSKYNFSNNPSYVTGSIGEITNTDFIGDPKSYITTIGLYNDQNELLAVAKLSKPLLKSYSREALIRVKLDF
jgi:hypothetical protein